MPAKIVATTPDTTKPTLITPRDVTSAKVMRKPNSATPVRNSVEDANSIPGVLGSLSVKK